MNRFRTHVVASQAYECVVKRSESPDKKKKKAYGALAHKLPGMILENGLAQATGFLLAKGKLAKDKDEDKVARGKPAAGKGEEHLHLLDDLNAVLRAADVVDTPDGPALHQKIIKSDLDGIVNLTRRSLEVSGWLKRYVQGVLRVDATGEGVDPDAEPDGAAE